MITYRLANQTDNAQLLRLTSSAGMPGKMALRIDRDPNFFNLNKLRGPTHVYVAVDKEDIVGCICVSDQQVFVNRKEKAFYYISDFKVAHSHRNQGIGLQLTNEVVKYLDSKEADLAFLNVSHGNKRPFVFFSNRGTYPDFQNIGTFTTFQYLGSKRGPSKSIALKKADKATPEILDFLNGFYSNYNLATVITEEKLANSDIYILKRNNSLEAVLVLIDTMKMKQNVVLKMPLHLKLAVGLINFFGGLFKLSKLPEENDPISMLYIQYLGLKSFDKQLISNLISFAKQCAYKKSYSFVSITAHENDPMLKALPKFIRFKFCSVGMLVSMKQSQDLMKRIMEEKVYRDYSIV
ncbi:MAG: GNAT family N-acetyltransferase [Flavobacteriaceae bacterium]|nr:GNAT family N-acetyltransferase [Flavobacteriaceae bacterium]